MVRKRKAKPKRKRSGFDNMFGLGDGFGFGTFVKEKNGSMFGLKLPKNQATGGLSIPKIAKKTAKGFSVTDGFELPQIEIGMTPEMFKEIPQDFDDGVEDEPQLISRNFPRDRALEGQRPEEIQPQRQLTEEELDEIDRQEEERERGADVNRQAQQIFEGEEELDDDVPSLFDSLADRSLGGNGLPKTDEEEEKRRGGLESSRRFKNDFEDTRFKQVSQGAAPLTELEAINFRRGRSFGGKIS